MYEGTPLVRTANESGFDTELDHLTLDCAWVRGCIPFVNATSEEGTHIHHLDILNFGGEGLRVATYKYSSTFKWVAYGADSNSEGAINSGPYEQMSIQFLPETCEMSPCGNYYQLATNCSMTVGFPTLTCPSGTFTPGSSQVGANVEVMGAGPLGAPLVTTILSYSSSSSVTLNANAAVTVSGTSVIPNRTREIHSTDRRGFRRC